MLARLLVGLMMAPAVFGQTGFQELEGRVAEIFQRSCALSGCHSGPVPQMNMSLERGRFVSSTVGRSSLLRSDLQLVRPGDPDRSYLVMKIEGREGIVGERMPFGAAPLSASEIRTIREWVTRLADQGRSEAREQAPEPRDAFIGWRVVNLPTNRGLSGRTLLAMIGHRFNPSVASGIDSFFGLDGSSIVFLSLGYALSDRLVVNLGRSNVNNDVELNLRYTFATQDVNGWPVSLGSLATINWWSEEPLAGSRLDAILPSVQLIGTHAFNSNLSGAVVPGLLFNPTGRGEVGTPLVTLGLGGRWQLSNRVSLVGEWVPIIYGYVPTTTFGNHNRFDSITGALEIGTAGHVFQIVAGNSVGIATDQYLRGGDLDIRRADVRLGFNIFRVINL